MTASLAPSPTTDLLTALKRIIASAPLCGLPLALEIDIQAASAIVAKMEAR